MLQAKAGGQNYSAAPMANRQRDGIEDLHAGLEMGKTERFYVIMTITPAIALAMLEQGGRQRPLSTVHVNKYARAMKDGRWKVTSEGFAFDRDGHIQQGRHRCTAIIKSGVTIESTVWFGTEPEEFEALDEGRVRSAADHIAMHDLNYHTVRAAIARFSTGIGEENADRWALSAPKVRAIAQQQDTPTMTEALRRGQQAVNLMTPSHGVLAYWWIATHTADFNLHKLPIFWELLCRGAGLNAGNPVLAARDFLMANKIHVVNARSRAIKRAAAVILAWNAYVTGRKAPRSFVWDKTNDLPPVV